MCMADTTKWVLAGAEKQAYAVFNNMDPPLRSFT